MNFNSKDQRVPRIDVDSDGSDYDDEDSSDSSDVDAYEVLDWKPSRQKNVDDFLRRT